MVDQDHRTVHPRANVRLGVTPPLRNVSATTKKPLIVEKRRRRSDPPKVDPAKPLGTTNQDEKLNGLSLTKSEQAARLDALAEAQIRAPEERFKAAERARDDARRELANRVAQNEGEITRAAAERDLQRERAELAVQQVSELRSTLSLLTEENSTLRATLGEAEENLRRSTTQLHEEMSRSEQLSSQLTVAEAARAAEMDHDRAKYQALIAELRNAERQLADLRSKPWWRRIRA